MSNSSNHTEYHWPGRAAFDTSSQTDTKDIPPIHGWERSNNNEPSNITEMPGNETLPGAAIGRTDCQGEFVMRYSDDGGESWSDGRYPVPYRMTAVDKANEFHGAVKEMWTVDQTKIRNGVAYFAFTKIGHYLLAPPEELWVLASRNILTERNASKVRWELLPDGDHGVPPPFRNVSQENTVVEEAHVLPLLSGVVDPEDREKRRGNGGFYMVGRTTLGYLAASWTASEKATDGWQPTRYAQYWDPSLTGVKAAGHYANALRPLSESLTAFGGETDSGAGLKNPRGPITPKMIERGPLAGLHLLLYYNNADPGYTSTARNPYWLALGRPATVKSQQTLVGLGRHAAGENENRSHSEQSLILWSQPEIVLYDTLRDTHPGYPDLFQDPEDDARIVRTSLFSVKVPSFLGTKSPFSVENSSHLVRNHHFQ